MRGTMSAWSSKLPKPGSPFPPLCCQVGGVAICPAATRLKSVVRPQSGENLCLTFVAVPLHWVKPKVALVPMRKVPFNPTYCLRLAVVRCSNDFDGKMLTTFAAYSA